MVRKFTPEEQEELRKNPYVKCVYESKLMFTAQFKNEFWSRYQGGEIPSQIFRSMGLDSELLGNRVWSVVQHIKKELSRNGSFSDARSRATGQQPDNEQQSDEWIRHKLAFLEQEVEFIKKTILLERDARRKCSSKKSAAQNSD